MATMEDAISAHISWLSLDITPLHNSAYVKSQKAWVKILKQTPRDSAIIERLIEQKKAALKQAHTAEQAWNIRIELTPLEWLWMIVNGSEKEWADWALLMKSCS